MYYYNHKEVIKIISQLIEKLADYYDMNTLDLLVSRFDILEKHLRYILPGLFGIPEKNFFIVTVKDKLDKLDKFAWVDPDITEAYGLHEEYQIAVFTLPLYNLFNDTNGIENDVSKNKQLKLKMELELTEALLSVRQLNTVELFALCNHLEELSQPMAIFFNNSAILAYSSSQNNSKLLIKKVPIERVLQNLSILVPFTFTY